MRLGLDAVACVEQGFAALGDGKVVMPPVLSMAIEEFNDEVDVKTAFVTGLDCYAIKMSPGFFDNPKIGLPATSGLMILMSARTGQFEALRLDNGYLTYLRAAVAGAVPGAGVGARRCIIGLYRGVRDAGAPAIEGALPRPSCHLYSDLGAGCRQGRNGGKRAAGRSRHSGLGHIVAGKTRGRTAPNQITIADLTGTGV